MKHLAICGAVLAVCLAGAVSAAATTATDGAVRATTACTKGSVAARIGGKAVCLHVGLACKAAQNSDYRRHGFTCVAGHLRKTPKPPAPTPPTPPPTPTEPTPAPATPDAFQLLTDAWAPGGAIPAKYTCDGAGVSPALSWKGTPAGTRFVAIALIDTDVARARGYTHWFTYNIPWQPSSLSEGQNGPTQGLNDANKKGYVPPCPPAADGPHHYVFHIYALSKAVTYNTPVFVDQFVPEQVGITLGEATVVGTYDH